MSKESVETVRGLFAPFADLDLVSFIADQDPADLRTMVEGLYTDDVEIRWLASMPDGEVYRGHEGAIPALTDWLDAWDDFRMEAIDYIDAGDDVLVPNVQRGRGKGSGAEVELRTTFVCTVRDGKIARITEYQSHAEALEAAGLPE